MCENGPEISRYSLLSNQKKGPAKRLLLELYITMVKTVFLETLIHIVPRTRMMQDLMLPVTTKLKQIVKGTKNPKNKNGNKRSK